MKKKMNKYITHDMSIAAYLLMQGRVIIRASKGKPGEKYVFEFENDDGLCEKNALNFLASECSKYDGYLRMLRGMIRNQ